MIERIFEAARKTFGKEVYAAWPRIAAEVEHALWVVWNPRYGPLNAKQREYACVVICRALEKAKGRPNLYGSFYTWLRSTYNHEDVDRGFKARAEELPYDANLLVGDVLAGIGD